MPYFFVFAGAAGTFLLGLILPQVKLTPSRDGPATANEPPSVELLAMLECSVSTSERCCEEVNITERSYSHTTFFPGICHCMLISRFPKLRMVNPNANELTVVESYL